MSLRYSAPERAALARLASFVLLVASVVSCGLFVSFDGYDTTIPSNEASLVSLSVSGAPLSPAFDPAHDTYTAGPIKVAALFPLPTTTTVTATAHDSRAQIRIAGAATPSGTASVPLPIVPGATPIDVAVTAADGKTQRHYTVVVSGTPSDYINASNTRPDAVFGWSVALAGDTLAVGSPYESSNATGVNGNQADTSTFNAGAVYVFTRTGAVWSQQAYIKASNPRAGGVFGVSVALSGDTLAVGSSGESSKATGVNGNQADMSASNAGAVYVFSRTGAVWSQQAYTKASNPRQGANFGSAVALLGDTLAVGSPNESSIATGLNGNQADTSLSKAGAVYVFDWTGAVWSQRAYVKASNTGANAYFGGSVALSGDTLAVGSPNESSNAGAAYVYR